MGPALDRAFTSLFVINFICAADDKPRRVVYITGFLVDPKALVNSRNRQITNKIVAENKSILCISVSILHGSTSIFCVQRFKKALKIYSTYSPYLFNRDNKMSGRFVVMPSTPFLMSFFISDFLSGVQTITLIPVAWAFLTIFEVMFFLWPIA